MRGTVTCAALAVWLAVPVAVAEPVELQWWHAIARGGSTCLIPEASGGSGTMPTRRRPPSRSCRREPTPCYRRMG
jgi:hypothetical protein